MRPRYGGMTFGGKVMSLSNVGCSAVLSFLQMGIQYWRSKT